MNIQHFEKGLTYTDKELLTIARKLGKLATYCRRVQDEASFIRIEAEQRKTEKKRDAVKIMINVSLPSKTLHAESRKDDVLEAVDRCIEKLQPQLERYREKHSGGGKMHRMKKPVA